MSTVARATEQGAPHLSSSLLPKHCSNRRLNSRTPNPSDSSRPPALMWLETPSVSNLVVHGCYTPSEVPTAVPRSLKHQQSSHNPASVCSWLVPHLLIAVYHHIVTPFPGGSTLNRSEVTAESVRYGGVYLGGEADVLELSTRDSACGVAKIDAFEEIAEAFVVGSKIIAGDGQFSQIYHLLQVAEHP